MKRTNVVGASHLKEDHQRKRGQKKIKGNIRGKTASIMISDDRFHIWTNVQNMCIPLDLPFEGTQEFIVNHVRYKNLFPFVKKLDNSMGFFLREPSGNFKLPAKAIFRIMFCSRNFSIAPEKHMPTNNRIKVIDNATSTSIKICYWPDEFISTKLSSMSNLKKDNEETTKGEIENTNLFLIVDSMQNQLKKTTFNIFCKVI